MDGSIVLHHDEKEAARSPEDILVRRLKNRERQRRYRARKRQEADLRKASSVVDQSTPMHYQQMRTEFLSVPLEVEISVNGSTPDYLTRTHCQRDWKKDARTAHMHKKQETCPSNNTAAVVSAGTSATFVDDARQENLQSNLSNAPVLDNSATPVLQSSRRHWKAEARNKRSSE